MTNIEKAVEAAGEEVERAVGDLAEFSKQPRFSESTIDTIFGAIYRWLRRAELEAPKYISNSRKRDQWLREFSRLEPHWAGVLNAAVLLDANRGWELVGSQRQVSRYATILQLAEGGYGWRMYMKKSALSYRVTDMCCVSEVGREGKGGPMRALYHVDPVRCKLTGRIDYPLRYYPTRGRVQKWGPTDFFRVVSMPSDDETFYNLGFCATSRAVELVKLLYAVLQHDLEKVGAKMPEGLLLLQGIGEKQWKQALSAREEELKGKLRRYFGGLMVLAGSGLEQVDAKLVALSQLPANFDRKVFIDMTMYAYALVEGRDPSEFWPVQFGSMGRGSEAQQQSMKATTKGGMDFVLGMQDRVQSEMPRSLNFTFTQRDEEGLLLEAQVATAWAEVATKLGSAPGAVDPILDKEHTLSLLADQGVIPQEWTEIEEDARETDTGKLRELALLIPEVKRAIQLYPRDPIVRYTWPNQHMRTLWERGADAIARRVWPVVTREGEILFSDEALVIDEEDVDRSVQSARSRLGADASSLLEAAAVLGRDSSEGVASGSQEPAAASRP